ncbi:MAG: type II toxin-antitoxin system PemK/MazF family toxin [Campylobacterota bacterium]|nr:type II toxin-antitoxin system PemK/MazF family toxin [Campylobacterota bacterium]
MEVNQLDIVLCEFYFSDLNSFKTRPVLVFKDNLPYDDFIAIPISSKIDNLKKDEFLLTSEEFKIGNIPKKSKMILRKTFVVSKKVVLKKYGTLSEDSFNKYKSEFCKYFHCTK